MSTNNEVAIPNTFSRNVLEGAPNDTPYSEEKDKMKNIYVIQRPLYPIPALVNYYKEYGFDYEKVKEKYPEVFPYDNQWRDWWREVNQIAVKRRIETQPIRREVPVIYRYKFGNREKIVWSERFIGTSTKTGLTITFKHLNGMYLRHNIESRYDEEKDTDTNVLRGSEKIYHIDYKPEIVDELYRFAPLRKQQKLQIMVMNRPYGNLGFFTNDEYRNSSIEHLTKLALSAKGLAHTDHNSLVIDGNKKTYNNKEEYDEDLIRLITNNPKTMQSIADALEKQRRESNINKKDTK